MDGAATNTNRTTRGAAGSRAPQTSLSRPLQPARLEPLALYEADQRRLSSKSPVEAIPKRRVVGSVVVASPTRAEGESRDQPRPARGDGGTHRAASAGGSVQAATVVSPPNRPSSLSRHSSRLSVMRLSLPSTPSATSSAFAAGSHARSHHSRAAHDGHQPQRWPNALKLARTESTFTVNSASGSTRHGITRQPSMAPSSRAFSSPGHSHTAAGASGTAKARRASRAFDDTELDIDACRAMLEAVAEDGDEGAAERNALQLSEGTYRQMQHNLARAVVALDKNRFTALLALCKDVCRTLRYGRATMTRTTIASNDNVGGRDELSSAERLATILDSVIDPTTGYTLTHLVVLANQTALTHAALRYGTAVHSVEDVEGETALMLAMRRAPESVKVLMALGKDVDVHRPLRMLVGESRRPLRAKLMDKAGFLRRWAAVAKGHVTVPEARKGADSGDDVPSPVAGGEAGDSGALVLSHRNLLHIAVMADEETPAWPGRVSVMRQLIEQHGLDAGQQDIFGFTPALLAREHAAFLGPEKECRRLQHALKEASLVQRLAGVPPSATSAAGRRGRATSRGVDGVDGGRPVMSQLANFALSVRSVTLLGGNDGDGAAEVADTDQHRRRGPRRSREQSLVLLAASLADIGDPLAGPATSRDVLSPTATSSSSTTPIHLTPDSPELAHDADRPPADDGAAALPCWITPVAATAALTPAYSRAATPSPARPHYEIFGSQESPEAQRGARSGPSARAFAAEAKTPPGGFVTLHLVNQSSAREASAQRTGPTPAASPARLEGYVFPTEDTRKETRLAGGVGSTSSPAALRTSPSPAATARATTKAAMARPADAESRVFLSQSPGPVSTAGSSAVRRRRTPSPTPVGVPIGAAPYTAVPHARGGLSSRSPSPGIPLAVVTDDKTHGQHRPLGVMDTHTRAKVSAVSAGLSSMLQVRAVDWRRWRVLGPHTRLGCLFVVLVLHCVAYALDVSCAYFREVRFGLWCRALGLVFGNTWSGSTFFMGLARVGCVVLGPVVGVLLVVYLLGRVCGCMLLRLPCFGAEDASEAPYLTRTFGLFVASFYEPYKRPRVFLWPLGMLLGLYSGALVYNAVAKAAWSGQAGWALVQPCLSTPVTYRTHFLVLWAVNLALDWLVICFVADLCYQQGLLGVCLPHFFFGRWTNWLEVKVYPWCRRWGCLWPVQMARHRGMVAAKASRAWAIAAQQPAKEVTEDGAPSGPRRVLSPAGGTCENDSWPCAGLSSVQHLAVHAESYRLWFFWVLVCLGWALIALVFLLVGLFALPPAGDAWYVQLGRTSPRPSVGMVAADDVAAQLIATAPFSAVRGCLAMLMASCALAVLCLAALQEWSWPVLLPHWHLSVPGLTVTGVHLGWLLWWGLFVLAAFDGRHLCENLRALLHYRKHRQGGLAGVVCGVLAMIPAAAGVCFLLVSVGRTSLWRLEADSDDDDDDEASGGEEVYPRGGVGRKTPGSTQSTSSSSGITASTLLKAPPSRDGDSAGTGALSASSRATRRQLARQHDAQRLWICRPDTLLTRDPVPALFSVLHYLEPDLPQWRTLLTPPPREGGSGSGGGGSGVDSAAYATAEAALQLFDVAVEKLAGGVRRVDDVEAHDRRLLGLLVQCDTDEGGDEDIPHRSLGAATTGANATLDRKEAAEDWQSTQDDNRLSLRAALHRRREHHARKRRECLTEVLAYAGGSDTATTVAARMSEDPRPRARRRRRDSVGRGLAAPRRTSSVRDPHAQTESQPARSRSSTVKGRLHRRQQEVDYLREMEQARLNSHSPSP